MSARPRNVRVKKMSVKNARKAPILQRLAKTTLGDVGELVTEAGAAVRRLLNTETKRFDASTARGACTSTGSVAALSLMGAGDDDNQRDGRSLRTTAIEFRARVDIDTAVKTQDYVRMVLFVDLENAGAVPTPAEILESVDPLSPFNRNNLKRFIPICDELVSLDTGSGTSRNVVFKTALDTHIRYRSTGAAAADMAEGNIFLFWVCGSATANTSFFAYKSRLSFIDN